MTPKQTALIELVRTTNVALARTLEAIFVAPPKAGDGSAVLDRARRVAIEEAMDWEAHTTSIQPGMEALLRRGQARGTNPSTEGERA